MKPAPSFGLFLLLLTVTWETGLSIEEDDGVKPGALKRLKNLSKQKISGLFSKYLDKKLKKASNGTGLTDILKAELVKSAQNQFKSVCHLAKRDTEEEFLGLMTSEVLSLVLQNSNILLKAKHPGVSCRPISECGIIYGAEPQHFVLYGFIKPEENHCHSSLNLVLCVEDTFSTTTTTSSTSSTTTATTPTTATSPTSTSTPVTSAEITTPQTSTTPNATFTGFYNYYNNVQIIGPKPVFITYNNVIGPSVTNHFGKNKKVMLKDPNDKLLEEIN